MADSKINVSYVVNNSAFNKNISDMKKNMQLLNQEVKTSAQEVNTYGKNIQTLSKKQESINNAIEQSKKIMAEYEKALDKSNTSLEKNKKKLSDLAKEKEEANKVYKEAIEIYGEESEEANKAKEALDEVTKSYEKQEKVVTSNQNAIRNNLTQIEKAKQDQLKLEQQLKETNDALDEQGNKFVKASEKFAEAGTKLENAGGKIKDLGSDVQTAGALIVGASAVLANFAMSAESGFAKIQTLVHDSGESLKEYKESVYGLSNDTGQGIEELTDALYNAISAGITYGESVEFINAVNKVAVGGFGEIADASSALTALMNIYGYTVKDVGDVSDKLFVAQEQGVLTTGELATVLGESASGAKAYNVNLDNLLSGYVSLTKSGIGVAESNTKLKAMFEELGDTGSSVGQILQEKTGKSFTQLMEEGSSLSDVMKIINESVGGNKDQFNALWSSSEAAGAGFIIASEDGEVFNTAMEGMANSAGKCDDAFNEVANTSEYKMKKSINEVKNSFSKLGESLLPLVDDISEGISKLADYIGKLSPETVVAIAKFGAMAIVFGTVMKATGSLVTSLGKGATGISNLLKMASNTKSLSTMTTAVAGTETAVGGLTSTLGGLTVGSLAPVVAGLALIAGAIYTAHEYSDLYNDSITKSTEEMSFMEVALGKLTGATMYSKEELENMGVVYEEWNDKVSPETQQSLDNMAGKFRDLQYEMDVINLDGVISQDEVSQLVARTEEMCSEIVQAIKNHQDPAYQAMYDLFMQDGAIDTAEQVMLDTLTKGTENQIAEVQAGKDRINEIYQNASNENRTITEAEQAEISGIQQTWQDISLENLTLNQQEREAAIKDFNERCTTETTEGLSELIQAETKSHEESKQVLIDKYESQIATMKEQLPNLEGAQKEEVEARIKQYEEAYKLELENEETLYDDKLALLNEKYPEMMQFIDKYTGEVLSKQDVKCNQEFEKEKAKYDDINGITESGLYRMYNKTTGTYDDLVVMVDEKTGEVIGVTKTWTDEQGMHTEKVTGYNEEVKKSMQKMQEDYVQKVNKIKSALNDQKNTTVNANGEIVNANGKVVGSLQDIKTNADGTKTGILNLNGTPIKVQVNKDGTISNIDEITKAINNVPKNPKVTFAVSANVSSTASTVMYNRGMIAGVMESGGSVESAGIYNTQERGLELIDTPSYASAVTLSDAVQGEYTYIPANSRVTNATMTTQKMKDTVASEVAKQSAGANVELINAFNKLANIIANNNNNSNIDLSDVSINIENVVKLNKKELVREIAEDVVKEAYKQDKLKGR